MVMDTNTSIGDFLTMLVVLVWLQVVSIIRQLMWTLVNINKTITYQTDGLIIQLVLQMLLNMNMYGPERKKIVNGRLGRLVHCGLSGEIKEIKEIQDKMDQMDLMEQMDIVLL